MQRSRSPERCAAGLMFEVCQATAAARRNFQEINATMKFFRHSRRFLYASLLVVSQAAVLPARASGESEPVTNFQSAPGNAGLGFVVRAQPSPYRDAGPRADILPLFSYDGERFFLHANRVGLKLLDSSEQRLDLFIEKRLEGFPLKSSPASLAGMATRNTATDAGLSYRYRQPWGTLQAELMHGVGDSHKGSELRLGYGYDWRSGRWTLRPSVSLAFRNASLNNYYYGVLPGEATASRPAYAPGAGINTSLGLYGSYDVSQRWRLLAGASATLLGSEIKNSPIVARRVLPAVYVGAAYDFGVPTRTPAEDSSPTYVKLLHGKSTEDGCHLARIITVQCFSTASTNRTNIAGVQVGKPFIQNWNGWPIDLVSYAGLTHHDERGLQRNGLQLEGFLKGYYSGFPWSDRVKTRLGLGLGLSLAQRAPYIETITQTQRGEPTSRLLIYLDPSVDVSLGDLLGLRALKETYVGFGVSHRSGLFSASRLLGSVNGGSNYIYGYVETAF